MRAAVFTTFWPSFSPDHHIVYLETAKPVIITIIYASLDESIKKYFNNKCIYIPDNSKDIFYSENGIASTQNNAEFLNENIRKDLTYLLDIN